jgi:Kef-type K+ transport system membrane component KefB
VQSKVRRRTGYWSARSSALTMTGLEDASQLASLGADSLIFLAATVAIVPITKKLNVSPVLGFLAAGLALGPSGFKLIRDLRDLNTLGEFGITFLLFEQGLELSLDRLKALSKYAFGLGTLQVLLSTLAFGIFPFGKQSQNIMLFTVCYAF